MCAQFMIKGPTRLMSEQFQLLVPPDLADRVYDDRIVPFRAAPVIVARDEARALTEMRFHLTPRWSKTEKVKWATYNARLDSIDSKASFKRAFVENPCLVLINDFIEPIYEGEHAGHMVGFHRRDKSWLVAAGIFEEWLNRDTGEVLHSFAIITDEPDAYVADVGHDRQPVFPKREVWGEWLRSDKRRRPEDLKALLKENKLEIDFDVYRDRAMRPGWEKRK